MDRCYLYRPQTKLREGNVFTPVCYSVPKGQGAALWMHPLNAPPTHPPEVCTPRSMHPQKYE